MTVKYRTSKCLGFGDLMDPQIGVQPSTTFRLIIHFYFFSDSFVEATVETTPSREVSTSVIGITVAAAILILITISILIAIIVVIKLRTSSSQVEFLMDEK